MAVSPYATYAEFTQVYSIRGVSESEISNYWLQHGTLRVNEALGGYFTLPFSTNNETAKDLSIHYGYLGILSRQRSGTVDELKIKQEIIDRVTDITCGNVPMILTNGTGLSTEGAARFDAWSTTQDFTNTFNMLPSDEQRVDPDLIDETRQDVWP